MRIFVASLVAIALTGSLVFVGIGLWKGEFRETWYNGATL